MTETKPRNERTDYGAIAGKIDYPKLEKKLEELREQEPPKNRPRASDVLAPVRDRLLDLQAKGWTYAQLAGELKSAGLAVPVGTLRAYLTKGKPGRKPKATRRA